MLSYSEQVRVIARRSGLSLADLARQLNTTPQNLNNKLKRDNWTIRDLHTIATAAGCILSVEWLDGEGKPIL